MADPSFPPDMVAGADQEMAQTRAWLRALADLHPRAVEELGALEAMLGLAAHIRDSIKKVTLEPENANGWGIAAIAVALLSEHLHPPVELPPMVVLQSAPPRQRYTDARGECSCHINPPCGWCSGHCCAEHVDGCLAGFAAYCCDSCPDQGD